jgi:glycosyltransferase involved in cell wall biosynthesis
VTLAQAGSAVPVKVSVIVATYNSPESGLARLVDSLDRQTLAQAEFEIVFVDDGSSDENTWRQLEAIRASRPNVQIDRIAHSGWPSRPRNVGMDLARGEYVFFADHDDEVFPDGLRAAWQFASDHDLDIVSVKEVETSNPGHFLDGFLRDTWGARSELGVRDLLPMVPHKLYRRELLAKHGVRFLEGSRVIWEDIHFNVDAFPIARRIGTLASVCVYYHVIGDANASHTYRPENEEYWTTVTSVLEHIEERLAADDVAADRGALFTLHYRDRVLRRAEMLAKAGDTTALGMAQPYMKAIEHRWLDRRAVPGFPLHDRRTDELVRVGDFDSLGVLAERASTVVGISEATDVAWQDDALLVRTSASWTKPPSEVQPGFLAAHDAEDASRIEAEFAEASSTLIVRARDTHETTLLDTTQSVEHSDVRDPLHGLQLAASARIGRDPRRRTGVFDVFARNSALGFTNTRAVRSSNSVRIGLIDGEAIIAYTSKSGMLAVDYGQSIRSVINSARREYGAAQVARASGLIRISLPLGGVHVSGQTRIEGTVTVTPKAGEPAGVQSFAATLIGDDRGARVELAVRARAGEHALSFEFAGRLVPSSIVLTVRGRWSTPSLKNA